MLLAGCSSSHPITPAVRAARICQKAVPGFTAASLTTVHDVRALEGGPPGARLGAGSFPGASDTELAAWCWMWTGTSYSVFAADETGARREFVGNLPGDPNDHTAGPPEIP